MGLKPREVKELSLRDFNLMFTGYFRRHENQWNQTRHVMWAVINFGGMGASTPLSPENIWPLEMDKLTEKRMITSLAMAIQLLKEFD